MRDMNLLISQGIQTLIFDFDRTLVEHHIGEHKANPLLLVIRGMRPSLKVALNSSVMAGGIPANEVDSVHLTPAALTVVIWSWLYWIFIYLSSGACCVGEWPSGWSGILV